MAINNIDEHTNQHGVHIGGDIDPGEGIADGAVTPGAIIIKGTEDNEIAEAGAGARNWLGYALDNVLGKDGLRTDYADGARVRYNRKKGARFMGILVDGATVTKGTRLKTTTAGALTPVAAADAPDVVAATYYGNASVTASGPTRIACKLGDEA